VELSNANSPTTTQPRGAMTYDSVVKNDDSARARAVMSDLRTLYPQAITSLRWEDPFRLLIATILSAQCTDARVNQVTPALFRRFPDARAMAQAEPWEIENLIRSTGFFRNKAKNILGAARTIVEKHRGEVPRTMEELLALPGVARKTANCVLGTAFGQAEGVVVDTHVGRIARRMGFSRETNPVRVERDLMHTFPRQDWIFLSHAWIEHGRAVCTARKARCEECRIAPHCPRILAQDTEGKSS
jgi:endonuclease-3